MFIFSFPVRDFLVLDYKAIFPQDIPFSKSIKSKSRKLRTQSSDGKTKEKQPNS